MKKGQVFEGVIEKVAFPNKGHITVDGKTVIVKNGVPGQKVRFSVNKVRSGRAEGRILEVLEKSPLECEPVCPHFADCGGCTYQNLSYEEQLHLKETQVKELLDGAIRDFGYEYVFEGIKESPNHYDYRNKMEFSFGDEVKDGPLALGMHKRGSFYDIVTVDGCRLTDGDFRKILRATLDYFTELGTPFYRKLQHTGYLRHLLVRKAARTGQILVSLVTTSQMDVDLEGWKETLLKLPLEGSFAGILHTTNDSLADVVQSDRTEVLYGEEYFYEELLGLRFRISTFSFFQTNSLGAEVLYDTARSYVGDTKDQVIFDLYSGTGTIAQMLAPVAKKVIGVEIVEEAVKAAGENAKLNGLTNCEFIAGDVLKMLDTISDRPDFIVLDPPRDGIHPKALKKIIDYGVDRMIYISCKPTSLARDLEMLQGYGYRVERACCVDMFPWSANVETVVLLSQQKPDDHIEIEINLDEIDATSAETKATYKEIEEWVQEHYGFHVTNLNIAQVKQKYGIIERENYNRPKSENSRRPGTTPEKEKAITEALKYFKMI
ncbi:23S rRNA (uracil(1939)-C(5))-methyltransferase RlmD [Hominiventricola aquisgranensis]|uniref:23S rRNA (Uracil(1939)-C(5))-methyltransferase RlmD n=1 Tax=Hominiventricola aquisgranensis TaxID=3133164 RepID=A0ABV1I3H9_9FIRM